MCHCAENRRLLLVAGREMAAGNFRDAAQAVNVVRANVAVDGKAVIMAMSQATAALKVRMVRR